ncbi:MAG: winged helix-turn-helix transcriptional regulator [Rhodopirellula sp.]|nr:winged helix-turn-helix transcriptional regulator [Rhodopirellula sp.]
MAENQNIEWKHVFEACRGANTPEPLFQTDPGEVSVEFPFSAAYLRSLADLEQPTGTSGGTTQKTTQKTTPETTPERIVALLRENPRITRKALAQQVGITLDGVKYHLGKLRQANRIRHVGPTKKGRWEVLDAGGQP